MLYLYICVLRSLDEAISTEAISTVHATCVGAHISVFENGRVQGGGGGAGAAGPAGGAGRGVG